MSLNTFNEPQRGGYFRAYFPPPLRNLSVAELGEDGSACVGKRVGHRGFN